MFYDNSNQANSNQANSNWFINIIQIKNTKQNKQNFKEPNLKEEQNEKLCIICMEENGINVLCKKCKYKYCSDCSNKINNNCSICVRTKNYISPNGITDINDYNFIYENIEDYGINEDVAFFRRSISIYFFSIGINILLGFCWIIIFSLFGFVCFKFIYNIVYHIITNIL